jgi:hypothetical protein
MTAFDDILDTRQRAYSERRPLIDASLEQLDLDRMADDRVKLESRLMAVERTRDVVALGSPEQQALWGELTALEPRLAQLGSDAGAEELRRKHELLKGLLMWDLERDYKARLWTEKKHLRRLDIDLKEALRRRHQVAEALDDWPEKFGEMTLRIESLTPRLESIREAARQALAGQHRFLEAIAIEELQAQRERLSTYRVQARFSLASIYDRAANSDAGIGPRPIAAPSSAAAETVAEGSR